MLHAFRGGLFPSLCNNFSFSELHCTTHNQELSNNNRSNNFKSLRHHSTIKANGSPAVRRTMLEHLFIRALCVKNSWTALFLTFHQNRHVREPHSDCSCPSSARWWFMPRRSIEQPCCFQIPMPSNLYATSEDMFMAARTVCEYQCRTICTQQVKNFTRQIGQAADIPSRPILRMQSSWKACPHSKLWRPTATSAQDKQTEATYVLILRRWVELLKIS